MRKLLMITFVLITIFLLNLTTALAVTLDFESDGIVSTPAFSTDVQFGQSSSGVNIVSQVGAPGPPFSPSRSARWDPSVQPTPDDPYRADFSVTGVTFVSVVIGDNAGDTDPIFLNAFKIDGTLLGSDSQTLPNTLFGGKILSVSAPDIAYVEFGRTIGQVGEGNSVQFDNFTYQTGTTPIPEPSTALLIGTGLLGLTFWRIRQTKKAN